MPGISFRSVVLDAPDAAALGAFYQRLLGWPVTSDEDDGTWFRIAPGPDTAGISIQYEPLFVRPVWPAAAGQQQMQAHLDLKVDDLVAACAHAEECGATLAEFQPQDDVRVYLDPVGHPFCLFLN
jgi:catechol 2,3-dioxygenase-like lactoylglutathione lyase family enzyme